MSTEVPTLRGMRIPPPRFRIAPLPEELRRVRGFKDLQTFFPALSKMYRLSKHQSEDVWLDSPFRIQRIDISGTSGPCRLDLVPNLDASGAPATTVSCSKGSVPAFLKVTHLLDPIRWMKGQYSLPRHSGLPWHNKTWATAWSKLQDPWNQAYVEAIAAYALGRLREEGVSPHFNCFYGAFCARAEHYRYNLTQDFASMRNARWFWNGQKRNLYALRVVNATGKDDEVDPEFLEEVMREPSEIHSEDDHDDCSSEGEMSEEEILVEGGGGSSADAEDLESLHSGDMSTATESEEEDGEEDDEDEDEEDDESLQDDYRIYAELRDVPVMMIALEENNGTMDKLLDDPKEVGAEAGTPEWEARWCAWLFQVTAALSCLQTILGFTHNDLHTNNIVWTTTKEEYLYYTNRAGAVFRVPTYGKLFRLIDFGRAIFRINDAHFISDDFRAGNDAEGQYCFKPLHPRPDASDVVEPNPSFDLSRLAVSLLDAVFPSGAPDAAEDAPFLSQEEGLDVRETRSPLYNMIWKWLIDDDGRNILIEPDGEERFPDFDLYKHIAAKVHTAVPALQFQHPAFDAFQIPNTEVPSNLKAWNLFC